jgi:hypothetical protein
MPGGYHADREDCFSGTALQRSYANGFSWMDHCFTKTFSPEDLRFSAVKTFGFRTVFERFDWSQFGARHALIVNIK